MLWKETNEEKNYIICSSCALASGHSFPTECIRGIVFTKRIFRPAKHSQERYGVKTEIKCYPTTTIAAAAVPRTLHLSWLDSCVRRTTYIVGSSRFIVFDKSICRLNVCSTRHVSVCSRAQSFSADGVWVYGLSNGSHYSSFSLNVCFVFL